MVQKEQDPITRAYYQGQEDAIKNKQKQAYKYRGEAKRAYNTGFNEGRKTRAALKDWGYI